MSRVTIKGKVHKVDVKTGTSAKGEWKKTTVVVDNGDKYNNLVPVDFFNKEVETREGTEVEVDAFVGGREYKGNFYPDIKGSELRTTSQQPPAKPAFSMPDPAQDGSYAAEEDMDDGSLPF